MIRPSPRPGTALLAVMAAGALVLAAATGTGTPAAAGVAGTAVTTADEPPEQLKNGTFDAGTAGWYSYGTTSTGVVDGQLCSVMPGGQANPWDSGVGQNDVPLVDGAGYTLSFDASASPGATVRAAVQLGDPPYTGFFSRDLALTPTVQHFSFDVTATAGTLRGQVAFQLGMAAAGVTVCVDNVSLRGGEAVPPYEPDTAPRVRVNQVGYLPLGPKNATVVTGATGPLPWELRDLTGRTVASGQSTPRGVDAASGQNVQTIDFSGHTVPGTGYTLVADGETSFPFTISGTVYDRLRSDALQFFYIQRSGIAIDGDLVGAQYARPPGHLGIAPNQGDTSVPCQPGVCDYSLDVRGGWYDAGDHGKYVVNGGIATAQLLSTFERTKWAATAKQGALGDGTLRVPERGNGVPDVLDEARWELDFLMRMQVPAGQPRAGMAHHKIHDANWTGLPLAPEDDPQPRYLHPPTTAATLNLAAVTAQAARLFAPYDPAYAAKLLASARTAWAAAKANPFIRADDNDASGGGAYGDGDVSDEYYWAAAELYLTTGEAGYLAEVTASKHHTGTVFTPGGFSWADTAALGRLDLATVPSGLPDRDRMRACVLAAADGYLATLRAQAYGLPLPPGASYYVWGSNSSVLNNIVVLGTAYDISRNPAYRDGAVQGMDYILGRNALNHSYVTGWGERASRNQHSRLYGGQLDDSLPHPPAGSLAGGPNAALQDPFAANLLAGCAPQFCYVDDIQSYATNEVAINWNSALSWVASFLADQGDGRVPAAAPVAVEYLLHGSWPGGFIVQVIITNTGSTPINGWELRFAFLGDQRITQIWSAGYTRQGATVVARNLDYNATIRPGRSVTFGFLGATAGGPNPTPALFMVNGQPVG